MKLFYRPVSPWRITQYFGENKTCVDNASGTKTISCDGLNPPEGYRSAYSQMKGHNALDLQAYRWQPVYAAREGVVRRDYPRLWRTGNFKTRYWHFISLQVERPYSRDRQDRKEEPKQWASLSSVIKGGKAPELLKGEHDG